MAEPVACVDYAGRIQPAYGQTSHHIDAYSKAKTNFIANTPYRGAVLISVEALLESTRPHILEAVPVCAASAISSIAITWANDRRVSQLFNQLVRYCNWNGMILHTDNLPSVASKA